MNNDQHGIEPIYQSHLRRWMKLGDHIKQRSASIEKNIQSIANLTEQKTVELSQQFQSMAQSNNEQNQRMKDIIELAHTVNVGGESIEIKHVSTLFQEIFINSISCILEISKQAMGMIYSLDGALNTLNQIEKSIREIESINRKTKYLSLNATIEAVRAGESGESFQVVASEVRELSNDTQNLATNIRSQVNEMNETLMSAQKILQDVARIDISGNIAAKEKLEIMMQGLVDNTIRLSEVSQHIVNSMHDFSASANNLIINVQFQDQVKQDFNCILKDLQKIQISVGQIQSQTRETFVANDVSLVDSDCEEFISDMSDSYSLKCQKRVGGAKEDDIVLF